MKKVRISPAYRKREDMMRQNVLSASLPYEQSLIKYRTALIKSVAKDLKTLPPQEWEQFVKMQIEEPYLLKWFKNMYLSAAKPSGERAIKNFLNIKSGLNTWEQAVYDWIGLEMGKKIVLITDTLKEWTINTLLQYMDEHRTEGVEKMVAGVENEILKVWDTAKRWQIRRIVQTESLTAMSEAADVAIKSLGIKYNKTWGISGNNTRPAHVLMDGVTIGQHELFNVGGELMEYPRDSKHGASAGNIINCCCYCIRKPINDSGGDITDEEIINLI